MADDGKQPRRLAVALALALAACGNAALVGDAGLHGDAGLPDAGAADAIDPYELPTDIPTVGIEVAPALIAQLELDPFAADDVIGVFIDEHGRRYQDVDINFRGAYALQSLISGGNKQRNWKIKFGKVAKYRGRREWNFNYERHLRQKLAYDLMRFAGVKVPSTRLILLELNGDPHGLYLEYEDPDNADWLEDSFGNSSGDLYKAAFDLPGYEQYFADLTYLGGNDADYFLHYQKKTNTDGAAVSDYSSIRDFTSALASTPDAQIPTGLAANFEVEALIDYLVVQNFICNWDSYPQRPKNYWLYHNPAVDKWTFIPWDLDATFLPYTFGLNPMGTDASIFFQFDQFEPYDRNPGESTERPLVRRTMPHAELRTLYISRYRQLVDTILGASYLTYRIDGLTQVVREHATSEDVAEVENTNDSIRSFLTARTASVAAELDALPASAP